MQQKVEIFCKLFVVDVGYLSFNNFYFVTVNSTFDAAPLHFFVINLTTVALFVLDESHDTFTLHASYH